MKAPLKHFMATAVAGLLSISGAFAADSVVLRAGHVIDPATGKIAKDRLIVVTGDTITAIDAKAKIPGGSTVIDLSNAWVLPGLMDAHTHLTFNAPPGGAFVTEYYTETSAYRALRGVYNARLVLEAGFTTIKDIGNSGPWTMADVRRAMADGWFVGPTIFDAGKIIAPFGGQTRQLSHEFPPSWHYEYIDADTPEEVRKAVRQNIYYGANTIKLVADNNKYFYTVEEIRAAVEEAGRAGMKVAVHTGGGQAATNVILGGAAAIEHGFELTDEQLKMMKERGTYLSGTDFPEDHLAVMGSMKAAKAKEMGDKIIDRLRRAWKIGTPMVFSTDVVVDLPGKNRAQMNIDFIRSWIAAGIPPSGILKAMVTDNAILLGVEKERGALKPGFKADIIAAAKNPLDDINALRDIKFVMKNGAVVKQ